MKHLTTTTLIVLAFAIMIFGVTSNPVLASAPGIETQFPTIRVDGRPIDPAAGPAHLVHYLYVLGLGLGGVLAFAMIAIAGLQWTLSGANPSIQEDAKDRIRSAIFGLLLLLGAFVILNTINPELVHLRDPDLRGLRVPEAAAPPPTHRACVNFSCVVVAGVGPDRCREDVDCMVDRRTHACLLEVGGINRCTQQYTSLAECQADIINCPRPPTGLGSCVPINECPALPPVVGCPPEVTPYRGRDFVLGVELDGMDPEARQSFENMVACARRIGAQVNPSSAFRSQTYQDHFKAIFCKYQCAFRGLNPREVAQVFGRTYCSQYVAANVPCTPNRYAPQCNAALESIRHEWRKHGLTEGSPPANISRHTSGCAVDMRPHGINPRAYGFYPRGYVGHFEHENCPTGNRVFNPPCQ